MGVATDTMLRVSTALSRWRLGQKNERMIMGNVAVAEELAGLEELDELYKLDASESEPEDDEDDDKDKDKEADPGVMPQGDPDVMPQG